MRQRDRGADDVSHIGHYWGYRPCPSSRPSPSLKRPSKTIPFCASILVKRRTHTLSLTNQPYVVSKHPSLSAQKPTNQ
jgi:hypothetical protein